MLSQDPTGGRAGRHPPPRRHSKEGRREVWATGLVEPLLAAEIRDPYAVVFVAEREGAVVGYVYAVVEGPDYMALRGPAGVFHDLVVDREEREQGVGRALLDAMLVTLSAWGAPRAELLAAERNKAAQRLFTRAGFRPTMVEMTG
ncbi:MAG TPA: GNAT family N-acetyltransferase [Rubricoccaceae bacterium]|jgi:ribosomal protein S18 acetylase RimI-like enzyme